MLRENSTKNIFNLHRESMEMGFASLILLSMISFGADIIFMQFGDGFVLMLITRLEDGKEVGKGKYSQYQTLDGIWDDIERLNYCYDSILQDKFTIPSP